MVFLQYYLTAHILQKKNKEMIKRVILGLLWVSGH